MYQQFLNQTVSTPEAFQCGIWYAAVYDFGIWNTFEWCRLCDIGVQTGRRQHKKQRRVCENKNTDFHSTHTCIHTNLCALLLLYCPSSKLSHSELTVGSFEYFRLYFWSALSLSSGRGDGPCLAWVIQHCVLK